MASHNSGSAIATSTFAINTTHPANSMKSYASAAAAPAPAANTTTTSSSSELVQTFKQKAAFMKTWRPASQPSVRYFVM